ncbi:MAG: helix-hairpin-helix domain-containing protein [Richelia sp.]|nr:helix-hairpin-helix domain-containing protein [Richelia sp.]
MVKLRYVSLGLTACAIVTLYSCVGDAPKADNSSSSRANSASQSTDVASHSSHSAKQININTAILSELDKFEAKLGIPALSNKIQASRPYGSPEDLVTKKVITQEQFNQIKDMVTVKKVVLTGEAKHVDYMTKLGLMKGHLLVAQELLEKNQPKQAEPHIGHPVEEIYVDVEEQLNERKVKEFKTTLISLQDLIKANPKAAKLQTDFTASMKAVDNAIATLPETLRTQPAFGLQVINGLLDAANAEYGAAIANGKIAEIIEYQDSRGFVIYAQDIYKTISPQMAKAHPEVHKAIETSMNELVQVWPSVIPPAAPAKSPDDVNKLVTTIAQKSQKLISAPSTKAQRY